MAEPAFTSGVPAGETRVNQVAVEVLHSTAPAAVPKGTVPAPTTTVFPAEFFIPDLLLRASLKKSGAVYVDVNPIPNSQTPDLLYDAAAVFASVRNLIMTARGARSAIFQEDYFCEVYDLLQEPFDSVTASQLSIAIHQALLRWEPRIAVSPADIKVTADSVFPHYQVVISMVVNNTKVDGVLTLAPT